MSLFGSPAPPSLAFRELPAWLGRFPAIDANPARHAWRWGAWAAKQVAARISDRA